MNQTRALIEAAERAQTLLRGMTINAVMERGIEAINAAGLSPYCVNEGRATGKERISTDWLESAISSAKAAEEGVETRYEIQQVWKDDHVNHVCYARGESDGMHKITEQPFPDQLLRYELVRRDTYTTVIEVREKEGL